MLTIDADLQKAVEDGFKALGYWGAAVILDPRNGEVLSLVSLPAYDPNRFASGIDRATWSQLNTDPLRPLQNRAIQGRYSPGSTFKIVVATAALEEGLVTPDFKVHCGGGANFYGRFFKCHLEGRPRHAGHAARDREVVQRVLLHAGQHARRRPHPQVGAALGLAEKTGIDLPHEVESIVPSTEWKRARTGEKWYAGETISVAIGQGQVIVTPIALATMMSSIANGGTRQTPHLVKAVDEGDGWKPVDAPAPKSVTPMKPENVAALHDGLWMVVNAAGTGGRARLEGDDVSGKTGTAQVISIQGRQAAGKNSGKDLRDHGWFVFFAPRDNPRIAGVIFAEHVGARLPRRAHREALVNTYFAKKEGRPLPEYPSPKTRRPASSRRPPWPPMTLPDPPVQADAGRWPGSSAMLERRLYFHIDWLLLVAVLVLAGDRAGHDLQHDLRRRARARRHRVLQAALRGHDRRGRDGGVPLDRLPDPCRVQPGPLRSGHCAWH